MPTARTLVPRALALALGVAVLSLALMPTAAQAPTARGSAAPAQRPTATSPGLPRTADGKPDLNGIWQSFTTASWDIQDHSAQQGVPAGQGIVVGKEIPYLPAALAKKKENFANRATADPLSKCYLPGVPRLMYMPFPFQVVQTPTHISMVYEFDHATRMIYTNGTKHPGPLDLWMGDSRGHWEGNTLVVDVVSFIDQTWFDMAGNHHSDAMHIVERYTPIDRDHLTYEATIEDPNVFSRPWKISFPLYRRIEANVQLLDYECLEFMEPFIPWDKVAPGQPGPNRSGQ